MVWGRIDDGHWRHRKVADLRDDLRKPCVALFWLAVSWANDNSTDGRVSGTGLRQLDGTPEEAAELVRVGLWEVDGMQHRIHDFLDFNKSSEQVEHDRQQRTMAGAAGAAARWSNGKSHSGSLSTSPSTSPSGELSEMDGGGDAPYPVSRTPYTRIPVPPSHDGLLHLNDEAIAFLEGMTGRSMTVAGPKQLTEYDRQIEEHGLPAVIGAYRAVSKSMRDKPQARQLVWSALRVLEPFVTPNDLKRIDAQDREEADRRALARRIEATKKRNAELMGDLS